MSNYPVRHQLGETHIEDTERRFALGQVHVRKMSGATPNVENVTVFLANNASPITVTDFVGGQPGQSIAIFGDGQMTVQHGTKIFTNAAANKLLLANKVYRFTLHPNDTWIEDA